MVANSRTNNVRLVDRAPVPGTPSSPNHRRDWVYALAVGLAGQDALGGQALGFSLLMLAPALLGMFAGQWLRGRISPALFKRCFFIGLALLGTHLLING